MRAPHLLVVAPAVHDLRRHVHEAACLPCSTSTPATFAFVQLGTDARWAASSSQAVLDYCGADRLCVAHQLLGGCGALPPERHSSADVALARVRRLSFRANSSILCLPVKTPCPSENPSASDNHSPPKHPAHHTNLPVMSYFAAPPPTRAMPRVWCSRFHTLLPRSPTPRSKLHTYRRGLGCGVSRPRRCHKCRGCALESFQCSARMCKHLSQAIGALTARMPLLSRPRAAAVAVACPCGRATPSSCSQFSVLHLSELLTSTELHTIVWARHGAAAKGRCCL